MTRNDFTAGQVVYLKTISHHFDCWKKEKIYEGIVTKVGRKYISVYSGAWEYKFAIDDDFREKTEYSPTYELFLSKRDIFDYWQREYLRKEIENVFAKNGKCLQLRTLLAIGAHLNIPTLDFDNNCAVIPEGE